MAEWKIDSMFNPNETRLSNLPLQKTYCQIFLFIFESGKEWKDTKRLNIHKDQDSSADQSSMNLSPKVIKTFSVTSRNDDTKHGLRLGHPGEDERPLSVVDKG